jgi:hypothetical protein
LAHAQDIIAGNWPEICDLADAAEELLVKCENSNMSLRGKKRLSCSAEKGTI